MNVVAALGANQRGASPNSLATARSRSAPVRKSATPTVLVSEAQASAISSQLPSQAKYSMVTPLIRKEARADAPPAATNRSRLVAAERPEARTEPTPEPRLTGTLLPAEWRVKRNRPIPGAWIARWDRSNPTTALNRSTDRGREGRLSVPLRNGGQAGRKAASPRASRPSPSA